ncbi:hypothetical protein IG631_09787 [Alternaria alternata]|nr:hypothetical protein IG631_09787 [Alternaria alternata]
MRCRSSGKKVGSDPFASPRRRTPLGSSRKVSLALSWGGVRMWSILDSDGYKYGSWPQTGLRQVVWENGAPPRDSEERFGSRIKTRLSRLPSHPYLRWRT